MEVMQDPGPYQPEHRGRHHDEVRRPNLNALLTATCLTISVSPFLARSPAQLTDHGGSDDGLAEAEAEDVQYDQSDILAALRQLRHDYELLLRENRSMEEYCEEVRHPVLSLQGTCRLPPAACRVCFPLVSSPVPAAADAADAADAETLAGTAACALPVHLPAVMKS